MKTDIIVSLLLGGTLFFSACSQEKQQTAPTKQQILPVKTITLQKKPLAIWATFTGRTKASSDQEIRARVSGILEERYFNDGDYVKKGQKLFKIQQDEYIAALNAAKAKKAQDEASLKLAYADVKRYEPLVQEGLAPRATLEQYQAKLASLKAAIEADMAQIKQAKLNLSYTIIKAPISGKISARYVDVGNLIGKGEATLLTTITQIDPLYAYFSPSNNDYMMFQKYKEQDKSYAFIELPSSLGDIRLDGYVDFSNNSIDPLTSTINMRAVIKNPEQKILPGSFVYVNVFVSDKYKFLAIPPEVVFDDQLGKFVYVVDNNNTLKRVDVELGYTTKYYVTIKKGLKDGDKLVVSALMKLKPGLKVTTNDATQELGVDAIVKKNNLLPKKR